MEITVQVKTVYGTEQVYPVCQQAQMFAAVAGTKTLTHSALQAIEAAGHTIKVQAVQPKGWKS